MQSHLRRVLVLDRGNYTTCTIILKGASITSWRVNDEEQIFMSRVSCLDNYHKYRGGISLIFPHFDIWEFGRQHGFARDLMWDIKRGPGKNAYGDVYVEFGLSSDNFTRSCWNYDFELRYSVTLKTSQLETRIVVVNPSLRSSFEFHVEQHWYLRVSDISKINFTGLRDLDCVDMLHDVHVAAGPVKATASQFCLTKNDGLRLEGRADLTFPDSPTELSIINEEEHKIIKIKKVNLPDFKIWNPWENANLVEDLDEDEVKYFVAIDTGNVINKKLLPPNSFWKASQVFEIIKTNKPAPKHKDFYDYFEDIC